MAAVAVEPVIAEAAAESGLSSLLTKIGIQAPSALGYWPRLIGIGVLVVLILVVLILSGLRYYMYALNLALGTTAGGSAVYCLKYGD